MVKIAFGCIYCNLCFRGPTVRWVFITWILQRVSVHVLTSRALVEVSGHIQIIFKGQFVHGHRRRLHKIAAWRLNINFVLIIWKSIILHHLILSLIYLRMLLSQHNFAPRWRPLRRIDSFTLKAKAVTFLLSLRISDLKQLVQRRRFVKYRHRNPQGFNCRSLS